MTGIARAFLAILIVVGWADRAGADEGPPQSPTPPQPIGGRPLGPDPEAKSRKDKDFRSPQHFAFEFKVGPYVPAIDSTPGLTGKPFSELFNDQYDMSRLGQPPHGKPLFTLEFDWQIWHGFGSVGLAVSAGFYRRSTHAFQYLYPKDKPPGPCNVAFMNCVRSADETTLTIMPFTLEAVYRFDVLALKYKVPFVPYVKLGLGYYFWFMQRGDDSLAKSLVDSDGNTSKGIGGTAGFVAHPGVAILLDVFDPGAARTLDADLGINHSYVFMELNYGAITGLGFKDKMVLSDTTWNIGLAFEF